jgi:TolB-like protein/class 3 adenylate cyclase
MSSSRQLAAILFTDIVGYTALMQENEQKAIALIKHYNSTLEKTVAAHEGKILNYYGDGSLCIFPSATEAVNCAFDLQKDLLSEPVVPLRIGLHIGELFFEDGKALGDGVNIASRIQSLGQANTVLFSKEIFDKIKNHPEFKAVSLGHFDFKNVDEPMEVFALANEGLVVPKREKMEGKLKELKKKSRIKRNMIVAPIVLILLSLTAFVYLKYFSKQNNEIEKSIAVLPFENMSNDPQQEYFSQGMREEILNQLYKIGGLNIISESSADAYKDSKKTTREIANELGVGNLLTASVQKEGDRIKIFVHLINGKNDSYLWIHVYDCEFKDVFVIYSEIAQQIASALKIKIDAETKGRIENIPTTNTSAYNLYLQSKSAYNLQFESESGINEDANTWKKLLEQVIQSDSTFAPAYADLGLYWLNRGAYRGDLNAKQVLDSAFPYLNKAILLDSNLASIHNYFALVHLWYQWDFKTAEKEWEKFFQLNPSGAVWVDQYNDFLDASGRFTEALDFSLKRFELDKTKLDYLDDASTDYYYLNQPNKAQAALDTLWSTGKYEGIYYSQALLSLWLDKYQQALDNLNKYYERHPDYRKNIREQTFFGICYFYTGKPNETQKIIDSLQIRSKQSPVGSPAFHIAMLYSATGNKELALQWLQKAYTDHEVEMYWLKVDPMFKPLHNDPRFQNLLNRIGFPT